MRALIALTVLAVLSGLQPTAHADVAGEWTLLIRDPLAINDEVPLTLEQDGTELTGMAGDSIVAGAVEGQRVGFMYEVDTFQVGRIVLAFTGTVADDDTMRGDVAFGRYGTGTWEATRR